MLQMSPNYSGTTVFGFLIICSMSVADLVILYDHANGEGEFLSLHVTRCLTLPRGWHSRVSSLLLMQRSCVQLHRSRICDDPSPAVITNPTDDSKIVNLGESYEFNDMARAAKPCPLTRRHVSLKTTINTYIGLRGSTVTLYEFVNKKGQQASFRIQRCTDVPPALNKNIASVDPKNCVRLYAGPSCSGDFVQVQPQDPANLNLHFLNFLDQTSSIGPCTGV